MSGLDPKLKCTKYVNGNLRIFKGNKKTLAAHQFQFNFIRRKA